MLETMMLNVAILNVVILNAVVPSDQESSNFYPSFLATVKMPNTLSFSGLPRPCPLTAQPDQNPDRWPVDPEDPEWGPRLGVDPNAGCPPRPVSAPISS